MTEVIDTPASAPRSRATPETEADRPPSLTPKRSRTFGRLMLWIGGTLLSIYVGTLFQTWWTEKKPLYLVGGTVILASSQGAPSKLQFLWDGEQIENACVTSVAVWNGGRAFIDASDLTPADPLRIVPSRPVRILEPRIVALSRSKLPVTLTVQHDPELNRQVVLLSLAGDALEHGDGFHISVFYAGPPDTDFSVAGRVKGTAGFKRYVPGKRFDPDNFNWSEWRSIEWRREMFRVAVFAACFAGFVLLSMALLGIEGQTRRRFNTRTSIFGIKIDSIVIGVAAAVLMVSAYVADTRLVLWFDALISPPSWIRL